MIRHQPLVLAWDFHDSEPPERRPALAASSVSESPRALRVPSSRALLTGKEPGVHIHVHSEVGCLGEAFGYLVAHRPYKLEI